MTTLATRSYNNKITRLLADRKVMEFIKAFPTIFHCSTQDIRGEVHTASLCENWRPELLQLDGVVIYKRPWRVLEQLVEETSRGR